MNVTKRLAGVARASLIGWAAIAGLSTAPQIQAGVVAAPALAPVGRLELQFDGEVQQFVLVGDEGQTIAGPQEFFDRRRESKRKKGLLGLHPEFDPHNPTPDMLVTFANSPNAATINEHSRRIGAGDRFWLRGFLFGHKRLRIDFPQIIVADPVYKVETYSNAVTRVVYYLEGERVGEPYYLLGGNSVNHPPAEVPINDPNRFCVVTPDLNTDSGYSSGSSATGYCALPTAPLHDASEFSMLQGKLALKGDTSWGVFEPDGFLDCQDSFATEDGRVTGARTENVEQDCSALVAFELEFDPESNTVVSNVADPQNQNLGTTFAAAWERGPVGNRTFLAYDGDDINCEDGRDPFDPKQATRECIGLTTCVGQPIRSCSISGESCNTDDDCGSDSGDSCRLSELVPPVGGFPDLVESTPAPVTEYGCILSEESTYVGSEGQCSLDSSLSCISDEDCGNAGFCQLGKPQIDVRQKIFIFDDVRFGRR